MQKKKILVISSCVPYDTVGHAGGQTHNYYLKQLNEVFDIYLISFGEEEDREKAEKDLIRYGINHTVYYRKNDTKEKICRLINVESRFNLLNHNAMMCSNFDEYLIIKKLNQLKQDSFLPDIIILEWLKNIILIQKIKRMFPNAKFVASAHDVVSIGYKRKQSYYKGLKRILWTIKYHRLHKKEIESLSLCNLVFVHNKENVDYLLQEGIEKDKLQWLIPYFNNMKNNKRNPVVRDILYFGAMGRSENYLSAIWFIENVMPILHGKGFRFVIVGGNPPLELKRFKNQDIIITGFVDDVTPYFDNCMCLVAPLVFGAGIKVKILEALSSGIPTLTNSLGIEGIDATDGREFFFCETPKDYLEIITKLETGEIDQVEVEQNAKNFIKKQFNLNIGLDQYLNLISAL